MGRVHKIFTVVKDHIGGRYQYRCVAGVHNNWLYGYTALEWCAHAMRVIQHPHNQKLLRIDATHQFVPNLMLAACTFDQTRNRLDLGVDLMEKSAPDNEDFYCNDGITVIDITEPSAPKYCFVNIMGLGCGNQDVPLLEPLSASTYVRAYTAMDHSGSAEPESLVKTAIQALQPYTVLEAADLMEVWPVLFWYDEEKKQQLVNFVLTGATSIVDSMLQKASDTQESAKKPWPLSKKLTRQIIDNAISGVLSDESLKEIPKLRRLLRDKLQASLREKFASVELTSDIAADAVNAEASMIDPAVGEDVISLELSGCAALSEASLLTFISKCPNLTYVSLTGHSFVNDSTLCAIAPRMPHLETIVLYGCGDISSAGLAALAEACPRLHHVYHDFDNVKAAATSASHSVAHSATPKRQKQYVHRRSLQIYAFTRYDEDCTVEAIQHPWQFGAPALVNLWNGMQYWHASVYRFEAHGWASDNALRAMFLYAGLELQPRSSVLTPMLPHRQVSDRVDAAYIPGIGLRRSGLAAAPILPVDNLTEDVDTVFVVKGLGSSNAMTLVHGIPKPADSRPDPRLPPLHSDYGILVRATDADKKGVVRWATKDGVLPFRVVDYAEYLQHCYPESEHTYVQEQIKRLAPFFSQVTPLSVDEAKKIFRFFAASADFYAEQRDEWARSP